MDATITRTCFLLLILIFLVNAADISSNNDTESEDRQPRVSGRIVKLYSGTRPEPIFCPQEGFQPDPADCSVFYRCVKGANNKFTVFTFQCGPGTVYDPDTEVCNFPRSTKRSECGGIALPSNEMKINENEIEGTRPELPSPINLRLVNSEAIKESTTPNANPWATSKLHNTQKPFTVNPWMHNQESSTKGTALQSLHNKQTGDACTKDGFMGDSENCQKFYRCVGNQRGGFIRYEFSCSDTTVWDDDVQSCNHPWAVRRSRCGRSNSDFNNKPSSTNEISPNNEESLETTIQEQLQINYGDKVTQTQTQISHGQVKQNQTQMNYGDRNNKKQGPKQNQTQISHGSAVSQTQTQINYGNGVQTQVQIDHKKESSQSQAQTYETTSKASTSSSIPQDEQDQGYGMQSSTQGNFHNDGNINECTENGFMGDKNDCKKFYRCVDNGRGGYIKYEFDCGEGTVWDSTIEGCNHAWAVKECGGEAPQNSPQDTPQKTTTRKPVPSSTTTDLTISDNEDTGYGSQNQESQTTTTIATSQSNPVVTTTLGDTSSIGTACTSSGFKGDPYNCKKFYRCVDNGKGSYTKYEFSCGEGTVWDPDIEACNHVWAVNKCGGTSTDINKIETTTAKTTAITISLVHTTTQASFENVDYDSGYGQQPSESSSTITTTTTTTQQPQSNKGNECTTSGFMGDTNDCKKFYRCVDNGNGAYTRYEFSCGEGTVWDSKIEACNHAWAVESCSSSSLDDVHKETTTSGSPIMSDEEVSPSSDQQTSYPTQPSTTTTQSTEQPNTTGKPSTGKECTQEGFTGDEKDCQKFYRCVDNGRGGFTKYEFSCGEGTVWDSEITACNHPNSVKRSCSSSNQTENISETSQDSTTEQGGQTIAMQSTEKPSTTSKPSTSKPTSNDCSQEGFIGDENDCKKFYRCVDNGKDGFTKYEFSCGEGTVWDSEINTCNHPSSHKRCGTSSTPTSDQHAITEPNRENDEMYTESNNSESSTDQNQSTILTPKPSAPDDKCISESFYGDSNHCKKFYRCVDNGKGGYTKYEFTCGDGTVWNQEILSCDHESDDSKCYRDSQTIQTETNEENTSTSSSTTEQLQTTQKPQTQTGSSGNCTSDGFYANSKDCKKFYRCVDNGKGGYTKYDFSCGEGTVWVQEIQACDHDTGDTCSTQNESYPSTTEAFSEQQSTASSVDNTSTPNQQPDKQEDETPNETSSQPTLSESNSSTDKCTAEGFYPNSKDCKKFYRCVDNGHGGYTKYDFNCGEGTAWDSDIQSCNYITDVESCQGQDHNQGQPMQDEEVSQSPGGTQTSTSGPATENAKPSRSDTCEHEGYYGNSQDCTKFYRCVDNGKGGFTKYDFTCGEGTIWDQDITACNHPQDVTNPSCQQIDNSDSSTSTSSTSSTSSSSSGTASSTTESGTSDCSQGSTKKPANKNVNCTKAGYYPDPDDCKKFYRCVDWDGDGKRFSVYHFECGEGTIWDPALDTCNHEDSVYPPRDCSGGTQSQGENVDQENSTTESTSTTTDNGTTQESTTEQTQTTTQESTTSEQTTLQTSSEQTTTEQTTTSEQLTTEQTTTQQSTTGEQTTQHTTTEESTEGQTTTTEQTTTQQATTQESTTQHSDATEHTTSTTESDQQNTTQQITDTESTTTEGTTEGTTTESTSTEGTTTENTTTEDTTTENTTEHSTTSQTDETTESSTSTTTQNNDNTTQEPTTESGSDQTTESSSSEKECPETDDDQNLFVCPTSFKRHPKYCNMFYQCTEDDDTHDVQIATFHCPNNTIYDESKIQCVEEKKAEKKCNGEMAQKRRLKRLDTVNKEPIVVTNERLKCPAPGHYPFEKGECSPAFLKCQKTKSGKLRGYVYQCPQEYVYWSVSRRCEKRTNIRDCKKSHNDWKGRWEIPIESRNVAP